MKSSLAFSLLLPLLIALSACVLSEQSKPPPTPTPQANAAQQPTLVVAVPVMLRLQGASFHLAIVGKHFAKAGLDVQIKEVDRAFSAQEALLDGTAQLAVLPMPAVAKSVNGNRPYVAIGAINQGNPLNVVAAHSVAQERGLLDERPFPQRMAGLKGLEIGLPQGPIARRTIADVLAAAGLDLNSDVTLVVLPEPELVPALRSGRVQALVCHEPDVETAIVDVGADLIVHTTKGDGLIPTAQPMAWYVLATTREYAQGHAEELRALVRALGNAQQALLSGPDAAALALRGEFPELSDGTYAQGVKIYFPGAARTPEITEASYRNALRAGGTDYVPFEQAIDLSYWESG